MDLIYGAGVVVGLLLLIVPGVAAFVWFGLAGPVVEIEGRTVRGAFRRSRHLVRGRFLTVLLVLGPIELIGDVITDLLTGLVQHHLGHSLLGIWAAESLSNIVLTPVYAVAAVLLTLDLIAEKDGHLASTLGFGHRMTSASIFSDFWNQLVEHDEQGLFLVLRRVPPFLRLHQDEHATDA